MNFLRFLIFLQILVIGNVDKVKCTRGGIHGIKEKATNIAVAAKNYLNAPKEPKPLEKWAKEVAKRTLYELEEEFHGPNPNDKWHMNEATFLDLSAEVGKEKLIFIQGPQENKIGDFWQMIVKQKINIILMVTDTLQNEKQKYTQYWPADPADMKGISFNGYTIKRQYGDTNMQKNDNKYTLLRVIPPQNEGHQVVHFHLKQWPEHGVPTYFICHEPFELWNILKNYNNIAVHGLADAGRIGMFVAIGMGLHFMEIHKSLDIPELVTKLRKERAGSVENVKQYLYIYYAFLSYAKSEAKERKIGLSKEENDGINKLIGQIQSKLYHDHH